ncbi:MAG: N-acetylmuramoyl-L-alanine amidase, partial [Clostridia bacterium]|nr:N-acetylmuramoyl-L-alanine amidase [Clostridia bacterium]
ALGTLNGKTYYESDINLQIALKLKDALLALGYNVIMTHDGTTLPENKYLSESSPIYNADSRCQFIKDRKSNIDLVISIHCNTFASNTSVKGSRYYILPYGYTGYNAKSETLASHLVDAVFASFSLASKPNQYTQNLAVLKSGLPSVLVECGFMTNSSDLTNLASQWWQKKYVAALADGIDAYCDRYL